MNNQRAIDSTATILDIDDSLYLRQLEPSEADEMYALVEKNREYLSPWLSWVNDVRDAAAYKAHIHASLALRQEGEEFEYGIMLDGHPVGSAVLYSMRLRPRLDYWVTHDKTNRGIATAAVRRLTEFGFGLGIDEITIAVSKDNEASRRVAEHAGYLQTDVIYDTSDTFRILTRKRSASVQSQHKLINRPV